MPNPDSRPLHPSRNEKNFHWNVAIIVSSFSTIVAAYYIQNILGIVSIDQYHQHQHQQHHHHHQHQ